MTDAALITVDNISKNFEARGEWLERLVAKVRNAAAAPSVRAVDHVSFTVLPKEIVGLVGESGCGKSTLGRIVAGVLPPSNGTVLYRGKTMAGDLAARLAVQMIFQDPYASLNPRFKVQKIVGEAPRVHGIVPEREIDALIDNVLREVGLDPSYKRRYPHQFSGGQRQRLGIARALAVRPEFIVCDEPVAALDVSIQAQVLNLFIRLREQFGLAYLFISHDLGVVRHIADRILIMYLGRIIESGPAEEIFEKPNHPYTKALLAEMPSVERRHEKFVPIVGEIPSPLAPPPGCHFHPRCPNAMPRCKVEAPVLKEIASGRQAACHLNDMT
jgi:peptide/nickel transport system ATP-binding protein